MLHGDWAEVVDHLNSANDQGGPPMKILKAEPVAIASAVTAVLNALVLLGVFTLDADQLAGINTAVVLVLGLVVRSQVTPNA